MLQTTLKNTPIERNVQRKGWGSVFLPLVSLYVFTVCFPFGDTSLSAQQISQPIYRQPVYIQPSRLPNYGVRGYVPQSQPLPVPTPQPVAHRYAVTSTATMYRAENPLTTLASQVKQTAHQLNTAAKTSISSLRPSSSTLPVLPMPSSTSPQDAKSIASPELYSPWSFERADSRTENDSGIRLVSDVSASNNPSSAPIIVTSNTAKAQKPKTSSMTEKFPILNIGKDLANEFRPSNQRKWSPNHEVLPTVEVNGNNVIIRKARHTKYRSATDYTPTYYDMVFNLNDIRTIDLIVVPFRGTPRLAHVETSFGLTNGQQIGLSIEARYEEGEQFDPLGSGLNQFELVYIWADERDLIRLGTDVNKNDVHLYRLKFEPNEVREMFLDAAYRTNTLAKKPEYYNVLTNSCVTNLIAHINKGRPKAVPKEYRTLIPGLIDNYLYDLGLVETQAKNFKEAKETAKVNWLVEKYGDHEYFSAGIRQGIY